MKKPAYRKKLIEVDLPLNDISAQARRERSIRWGHPSTFHQWWARQALGACRAVIFASLVDDPSSYRDEFKSKDKDREESEERARLHDLIRKLVMWETTDEGKIEARELIAQARYEVARSLARSRGETAPTEPSEVMRYLGEKALPIYDPFAGGGSIPLEAQRLGLRAIASDINPIAVLINKALIELPPKFNGKPPVNPDAALMGVATGKRKSRGRVQWRGAAGLAHDVRFYGKWMRDEAFKRIGHLYPKAKLPDGGEATVIAWLWARTVPCPNPACGVQMPLMATLQLSKKRGNQHWTRPVVDHTSRTMAFAVQGHSQGIPIDRTVISGGNGAVCVACKGTVPQTYIREQARAGNMGAVMTAVVAEGDRKRLFLSPTEDHVKAAESAEPAWRPDGSMPTRSRDFTPSIYGISHWHQLFTERQLTALSTFSDLLASVRNMISQDGADENYAKAVCTYLAMCVDRTANSSSSFSTWQNAGDFVSSVFKLQAVPMVWDYAEVNVFSSSTNNWMAQVNWISQVVQRLSANTHPGIVYQADASTTIHSDGGPVIVTDPPYYDNVAYADLSDFFYVWLRPLLRDTYPELFAGIATPKADEMIAEPDRFEDARGRFEDLLSKTLRLIREKTSPEFPSSIFYAYKQREERRKGKASTGWETMLNAIVSSGFQIVGTWPMWTTGGRVREVKSNALASAIILVCRPRPDDAPAATRREFLGALETEMPAALDRLTREGHIWPTDLAQAAIGPGMQVYSRYSAVHTVSGEHVTVGDALVAINRAIDNYFEAQEGSIDAESRLCLDWLRVHGYKEEAFGDAEVLSKARGVALDSDSMRGLLTAEAGRVKLLRMDEYSPERPLSRGMTAWEGCMRMAWHLNREAGEGVDGASSVAREMAGLGAEVESVERLARILYNHFDRKSDSPNAVAFNNVVTSWQDILNRMQQAENPRLL